MVKAMFSSRNVFFFLLYLAIYVNPILTTAQLRISYDTNTCYLINKVLLGGGIVASNIKYTGSAKGVGIYDAIKTNLNSKKGIILSNAEIESAIGPNNNSKYSNFSDVLYAKGDTTLDNLLPDSLKTVDASVLEFDFVPSSDCLRFKYIFASEQYTWQVCSNYTDVFGFFISGPKPGGGLYHEKNIALIPNTQIPVAINTINNGIPGEGKGGPEFKLTSKLCDQLDTNWRSNTKYYVDNGSGDYPNPEWFDSTTVQYNGFTVPLIASVKVVPCQKYHIKMVIADVKDALINSAVFLEAKSFSGGLDIRTETGDSIFLEGCKRARINFIRYIKHDQAFNIQYQLSGSATNGIDYYDRNRNPLNGLVKFLAYSTKLETDTFTLDIYFNNDGIMEPNENLILKVYNPLSCVPDTTIIKLAIKDTPKAFLLPMKDTSVCQGSTLKILPSATGGLSPVLVSIYGIPIIDSISLSTESNGSYPIKVTNHCGITDDSLYFKVDVRPKPNLWMQVTGTCEKDSIRIFTNNCIDNYEWHFDNLPLLYGCNAQFAPQAAGVHTLSLKASNSVNCSDSIVQEIVINPQPANPFHSDDITLCEDSSVFSIAFDNLDLTWQLSGDSAVVSIQNEFGCAINHTLMVRNKSCITELKTEVPTAFSPNNDGLNDIFCPPLPWERLHYFKIFNRWGNLIFSMPQDGLCWDGKKKGMELAFGTYYWILDYSDVNEHLKKSGTITLIK